MQYQMETRERAGRMTVKILLVILLIAAVIFSGIFVFLLTFNADRYRPQIIERLETALGQPVRLRHVWVGWGGGIALELEGLEVGSGVRIERASALLRWKPLLKKRIEFDLVRIGNAELPEAHIRRLSAVLRDFSLPGPVKVKAGMAVFGTEPNVDLDVLVTVQGDRVEFNNLSAKTAAGEVKGRAVLEHRGTRPKWTVAIEAEQLAVEGFQPPAAEGRPRLEGKASLSFEGTTEGLSWTQVSRTLAGSGRISLTDGVLLNFNALRDVFGRLSSIPRMTEALEERLHPVYREKMTRPYTAFGPLDLPFSVSGGSVFFSDFRISTEELYLYGRGRMDLNGSFDAEAVLLVNAYLSNAVVQGASQMQYLLDSRGQLEIPVRIHGRRGHFRILPDMRYIASRVGVEIVSDLLRRRLRKADAAAEETGQETSYEQLLGKLF